MSFLKPIGKGWVLSTLNGSGAIACSVVICDGLANVPSMNSKCYVLIDGARCPQQEQNQAATTDPFLEEKA